MKMKSLLFSVVVLLASGIAAAKPQKDIVDTAVGAGQFKTLVNLVQTAGLVDTLKGSGPFTVFAPTDKAFAKLPKKVVNALLADKELLKKVLLYHVVSGNVMSTDLRDGLKAKTVQGESITVMIKGNSVRFNKSGLVTPDIKATNGVIHVIDTVLIPPSLLPAVQKLSKGH